MSKKILGFLCATTTLFLAGNADAIDRTVVAKHGMVVAGHPLAVESGLRALRAGGTACDAAASTPATLGGMMPDMIGPAGSGLALLLGNQKKKLSAIRFNGVA